MFITFCDSGSQGRCSIKKQAGRENSREREREGGAEAGNWESYHKHGVVIEHGPSSVCSRCVIGSSADSNLTGNY